MSVYTRLTKEELEQLLNDYNIGDPIDIEGINEGITNSNFYLQTTKSKYILTVFEDKSLNLEYSIHLMELLSNQKIPCPMPIKSKANETIKILRNKPVAIFSLLQGRTISKIDPSLKMCEQIGEMIAKIQLCSDKMNDVYLGSRHLTWFEETYKKLQDKLSNEENEMIENEIKNHIKNQLNVLPSGIIHSDLFRDNALFIEDKLTGVIDFYYACQGYFLYDLAIIVNDWCLNSDKTINIEKQKKIVQAYNKFRKITQVEKDFWPKALRHAALRFWLSRLHDKYFPTDGELTHILDPNEFKSIFIDRVENPYKLIL